MAQHFRFKEEQISVGDTVAVHQEVSEGNKKRIQVFEGIVIAAGGKESGRTFTVRKVASNNIPVEKIFPLDLPSLRKITVRRHGDVRRAKLYFLREKVGRRATRIKEKALKAGA